jgi:uncharacterized HAD superfamily protein
MTNVMHPEFKQWLEKQEYTLTDSGLFTYKWDEVMYHIEQNNRHEEIYRTKFTWGLWRKIDE